MTFRKMLALPIALLVTASTLSAFQAKPVDITGKWSGTFTRSTGQQAGAYLDLKQKGAELTGTAGPRPEEQLTISKGKVTTVKGVTSVTFEATEPNGNLIKFDLKLVEERLKGAVVTEVNGEKREATLDVGRTK